MIDPDKHIEKFKEILFEDFKNRIEKNTGLILIEELSKRRKNYREYNIFNCIWNESSCKEENKFLFRLGGTFDKAENQVYMGMISQPKMDDIDPAKRKS